MFWRFFCFWDAESNVRAGRENCGASVGYYGVGIVVSIRNFAESWKQKTCLRLSTTAAWQLAQFSFLFLGPKSGTGPVAIDIFKIYQSRPTRAFMLLSDWLSNEVCALCCVVHLFTSADSYQLRLTTIEHARLGRAGNNATQLYRSTLECLLTRTNHLVLFSIYINTMTGSLHWADYLWLTAELSQVDSGRLLYVARALDQGTSKSLLRLMPIAKHDSSAARSVVC